MQVPEERELAERLDRVLDGREHPDGELAVLATVLERAAAPARLDVPEAEVERALATARPRVRRPTRTRPVLAGLALAGAVAAVLAVVLTRGGSPVPPLEGKALAALGGPSSVLRVIERVEPTHRGDFPVDVRVGWIDAGGKRLRWDDYVHGRRVAETLLEDGRVSRYLIPERVVLVGTSCKAFASGCADLVDPIELYRRALERGPVRARRTTAVGRSVYVLTLPVQTLPDALRIEQRVTIDAHTYRPLQIEWVEHPADAPARSFSRIVVERVRKVPPVAATSVFQLNAPGIRVVQRVAPGRGLRKLSERTLSASEARAVRPLLLWLGPDYVGQPAGAVDELRWNAGKAYRIRYGDMITVWNYGRLVPPAIAAGRYVPAKSVPLPDGRVARFYVTVTGHVVVELEGPSRSIALVAPQFGKADLFQALKDVRPLR